MKKAIPFYKKIQKGFDIFFSYLVPKKGLRVRRILPDALLYVKIGVVMTDEHRFY